MSSALVQQKIGTTSLAFPSNVTAGNLIVVYAIWSNTGTVTLSDSRGNAYASAAPRTTWAGNWSSQVFYANAPVVIAQNTVLSGVRTITLAPTGPGVSGAAGTGLCGAGLASG